LTVIFARAGGFVALADGSDPGRDEADAEGAGESVAATRPAGIVLAAVSRRCPTVLGADARAGSLEVARKPAAPPADASVVAAVRMTARRRRDILLMAVPDDRPSRS
jgi:hypothetical protein